MNENKKLNSGILKDVGVEIDAWLDRALTAGWKKGRRPHFSNGSTYKELLKNGGQQLDCPSLVLAIDKTIRRNFGLASTRRPSSKNWRFEPRSEIAVENNSPEVCLERAIVGQRKQGEWANQSPVASGLLGPDSDKGRHIDLIREVERGVIYELIELKWDSDNPLFAAMEILCYGLIYLFYREKFFDETAHLLKARTIRLRVLAPSKYYFPNESRRTLSALSNLECHISDAIGTFAAGAGVSMDFRFWEIPNCENPKGFNDSLPSEVANIIVSTVTAEGFPSPCR